MIKKLKKVNKEVKKELKQELVLKTKEEIKKKSYVSLNFLCCSGNYFNLNTSEDSERRPPPYNPYYY